MDSTGSFTHTRNVGNIYDDAGNTFKSLCHQPYDCFPIPFPQLTNPAERCDISETVDENLPSFRKITREDMPEIMRYLRLEKSRSTDFSYGGVLMWVDYYSYEYSIFRDTLFIKGVMETQRGIPVFSLPLGALPLKEAVDIVKRYCRREGIRPVFSAVPEEDCREMIRLSPKAIEEMPEIADYLYESESLAYLRGKKNGKKRNHVNQFLSAYPEWSLEPLTAINIAEAYRLMDLYDLESDNNESAIAERALTRRVLSMIKEGDKEFKGALLKAGAENCAFTVGDVKGDTLFVHIEKALREYPGSYETINKEFARRMLESHPELRYINREDAAGDEGLRRAKESYHPVALIRKFNVRF